LWLRHRKALRGSAQLLSQAQQLGFKIPLQSGIGVDGGANQHGFQPNAGMAKHLGQARRIGQFPCMGQVVEKLLHGLTQFAPLGLGHGCWIKALRSRVGGMSRIDLGEKLHGCFQIGQCRGQGARAGQMQAQLGIDQGASGCGTVNLIG
jgi:hypothetical protein